MRDGIAHKGVSCYSGMLHRGCVILITPALKLCHFQIIYVTGGEELTVISTAASATMENVRIEVVGHTKLVLEVPDFTLTAIIQSVRIIPTVFPPFLT